VSNSNQVVTYNAPFAKWQKARQRKERKRVPAEWQKWREETTQRIASTPAMPPDVSDRNGISVSDTLSTATVASFLPEMAQNVTSKRGPWGHAKHRGNPLEGLSDVLPYAARGQGWECWQGEHRDARNNVVKHPLPGANATRNGRQNDGDENPVRMEHIAFCVHGAEWELVYVGDELKPRRADGTGCQWSQMGRGDCPEHGAAFSAGTDLPAPLDDGNAKRAPVVRMPRYNAAGMRQSTRQRAEIDWQGNDVPDHIVTIPTNSDAVTNRVPIKVTRSRKTGRTTILTNRGEKIRPAPTAPVSVDYAWPDRQSAIRPDAGKVFVYTRLSGRGVWHTRYRGYWLWDDCPWQSTRAIPGAVMLSPQRTRATLVAVMNAGGATIAANRKRPVGMVTRKLKDEVRAALLARDGRAAGVLLQQQNAAKAARKATPKVKAANTPKVKTTRRTRAAMTATKATAAATNLRKVKRPALASAERQTSTAWRSKAPKVSTVL
jgi:hypothetical protein